MIALLTGGTGLIGRALGQKMVRAGHEVRVLARSVEGAKLPYPAQIFAWAGGRDVIPAAALEGIEAVIHLAGENIAAKRWTKARKAALRESRVQSGESLRRDLERLGIKLKIFVTASGVGVYGDRGNEELTEKSSAGDDFLARLCLDWERAADAISTERVVKARFGVALSSQGGFLSQLTPLFNTVGASRLGDGAQWLSWIHIDDLTEALLLLLREETLSGAFNVVAPSPITNAEMTLALASALDTHKAPAVPRLVLRLLYGELAGALLSSQRTLPARLSAAGFKWAYPDFESALRAIFPQGD